MVFNHKVKLITGSHEITSHSWTSSLTYCVVLNDMVLLSYHLGDIVLLSEITDCCIIGDDLLGKIPAYVLACDSMFSSSQVVTES